VANHAVKSVMSAFADLTSRSNYGLDLGATILRPPRFKGDTMEVPSISDLTVNSDGAVDATPESVTNNILTLTAGLEPFINANIPAQENLQLLDADGSWGREVAKHGYNNLRNNMDDSFFNYLTASLAYDATGTYHDNEAADTLTAADLLNAKAALLGNDGTQPQDLVMFVTPYAEASISSITAFIPNYQRAEAGHVGIPGQIGSVYGVPVYCTNSVERLRAIATTAVSISSDVATATVAAGHGIVAGQIIASTGHTTNTAAAGVAVTSVTATTVVYPLTADDGALADGVGTLTIQASENVMLDTAHVYAAYTRMPYVERVKLEQQTGHALQISSIWGRIGRAGRVRVINSPPSSI
tara:strand:- start:2475 stop:3542 length:1068 start_codon:yes stop_codon:yes gene_type:complete